MPATPTRDDDAALDIVQDAMIRLAEKYADRPPAELPLIFQRILANATVAPISEDRRAADVDAGTTADGNGDGEASGHLASTGA